MAEHPEALHLSNAGRPEDGRPVAVQPEQLGAAGVRVLVAADQQGVLVAGYRRRHAEGDAPDPALLEDAPQGPEILVRHLRGGEDADLRGGEAPQGADDRGDRLLPRGVAHRAVLTRARGHEPRLVVHERKPVAPVVADPPAVDVGVEARLETRHAAPLVVVRAPAVHVPPRLSAARAPPAHRRRAVAIPDTHREAAVAVGQGAHRADVHHVAGVLVDELLAREEPDLRVVAAVEDPELARPGDLVAEPHAARAEAAAL